MTKHREEPRVGAPPPRIPLESARAIAAAAKKQNHAVPLSVQAALDGADAPAAATSSGPSADPTAPAAPAEPHAPKE